MNVIAKDFATKAVVAVVAAAMFLSIAAPAKAQTAEELQAMINNLLAQIAALQAGGSTTGTGTATGFQFTRDLRQGSTGADVLELQKFLNRDADTRVAATGAGSAGMETSFYGPATAAAVSKFQVKYRADILTPGGLVNPTGFFGPSSRAKANALNSTTTPTDPTEPGDNTGLRGGEGDAVLRTLTDGNTTIDLGKADVVIEFEAEAIDSDVAINRVDFEFSKRPWLYFKEVNLLVDGREVQSLTRESDFTRVSGDTYRARFSPSNLVIREDRTADIALELVVLDSMVGTRAGEFIDVMVADRGVRFTDGAGITETTDVDARSTVYFNDDFASGDLRVTVADNSPENSTIVLEDNADTNGVEVAVVNVRARNDNITINDVEVNLTSSVSGLVKRVYLFDGNRQIAQAAATTTGVYEFDRIRNLELRENRDLELRVVADFNRVASTTTGTISVGNIVVDGENRNYVNRSANVNVAQTHNVLVTGVVSKIRNINVSRDRNVTTLTYRFDVSAYGDDFFIPAATTDATDDTIAGGTISIAPKISVSGVNENAGHFRIIEGQTREVTVTVSSTNGTGALLYMTGALTDLNTRIGSTTGTTRTFALPSPEFNVPSDASVNPASN